MKDNKIPLDLFDYELTPPAMKAYLRNYGFNFSKKACEYAVSLMKKRDPLNAAKQTPIVAQTKEEVEECFKKNGITLEGNVTYNHVYLFNMAIADHAKALPDDRAKCLFVKEVTEDVDSNPDNIFRKWIISMDGNGMPIYWEDLL